MRTSFRIRMEDGVDSVERLTAAITGAVKAKQVKPGEYRVTIETVDKERTMEQNRFYWAVLNEIAEETGNSNEDLHQHFRARFLQDKSVQPARIKSTTELSVREFIRYIDQIVEFVGTHLGISVSGSREF